MFIICTETSEGRGNNWSWSCPEYYQISSVDIQVVLFMFFFLTGCSVLILSLFSKSKCQIIHRGAHQSAIRWNIRCLYLQVSWKEQVLCRRTCVQTGERQQQMVQSFSSDLAHVVEWTWCLSPCSAGSTVHAEHRSGTHKLRSISI